VALAWELDKQKVPLWVNALISEFEVIAPVRMHGEEVFTLVSDGSQVALDYVNTLASPKEFFLPQFETMFSFTTGRGDFDIEVPPGEEKSGVIFGIRPCDVNALLILDKVFSGDQKDNYYLGRRDRNALVALGCNQPSARCFCGSVGGGPSLLEGFDVLLTELGASYLVETASARGRQLIDKAPDLFRKASGASKREKRRLVERAKRLATKPIDPLEIAGKMEALFDNSKWVELGKRCLQCGGCTYLCPTCWCFDVVDRVENGNGERLRCWDCCLLCGFTRMAGNLNPRESTEARIKQRFYHKWDYFVQRFGTLQCVGCGRCTETALCHIDWKKVFDWVTSEK